MQPAKVGGPPTVESDWDSETERPENKQNTLRSSFGQNTGPFNDDRPVKQVAKVRVKLISFLVSYLKVIVSLNIL